MESRGHVNLQRLFSHASIGRRRLEDWRAVAPYPAMSYLYKRSNRFGIFLIRRDPVYTVCRPSIDVNPPAPFFALADMAPVSGGLAGDGAVPADVLHL
jgi:hypothetical protein